MNSRFTTVLLDADETLLDFYADEKFALKATMDDFGLEWTEEKNDIYLMENLLLWKAFEKGEITRQQLWRLRFQNFFEKAHLTVDEDLDRINEKYVRHLSESGTFIDGACEFVKRLKTFARVYITTNGLTVSQTGRLKNTGLDRLADGVYISQLMGCAKPSKEYFDYIFNELGINDPSKVVIVGDSLTSDMQGGRNAGITTCLFNPKGDIKESPLCDYIIRDYDNFFGII